jgi:hypothetical protein
VLKKPLPLFNPVAHCRPNYDIRQIVLSGVPQTTPHHAEAMTPARHL